MVANFVSESAKFDIHQLHSLHWHSTTDWRMSIGHKAVTSGYKFGELLLSSNSGVYQARSPVVEHESGRTDSC